MGQIDRANTDDCRVETVADHQHREAEEQRPQRQAAAHLRVDLLVVFRLRSEVRIDRRHASRTLSTAAAQAIELTLVAFGRSARSTITLEHRDVDHPFGWGRAVIDETFDSDRGPHALDDQPAHLEDAFTIVQVGLDAISELDRRRRLGGLR